MRNHKGTIIAILLTIMAIAAIACSAAPPAAAPSEQPPASNTPVAPAEPQQPDEIAMEETPAPIESVELNIAESFPPQYFLKVTSGLPSGCVTFDDYEVSQEGNNIDITVTNMQPAPGQLIACTQIYGFHESNIALGSQFIGGETYTILVNDQVTETFVAQESGLSNDMALEPAPIESVRIDLDTQSNDAQIVVVSGLPNACYEFDSYDLTSEDNSYLIDIRNRRPADQNMACAEIYRTVETVISLDDGLEACAVYDVTVNGDAYSVQAIAPNVRCADPGPLGQREPDEPAFPTVEVPAPIESVQIVMTKSLPPQYVVMVTSGLPSGCATFHDYDISRDGNNVNINMTNLMPAPEAEVMCTLIYGYEETSINLGDDFEEGVTYTLVVNGEERDTLVGMGNGATFQPATMLNTQFQLEFGEEKTLELGLLDTNSLVVEFIEVTEDSRCPANVTCIWAGQAKVVVALSTSDGTDLGQHELLLGPFMVDQEAVTIGEYTINLVTLDPYPGTVEVINEADYTATLIVIQAEAKLNLSAQPEAGEAMTYRFTGEITGGPNNNESLYCVGTGWNFGDRTEFMSIPSCIMWTPDIKIQRQFQQIHTYEAPGTYEVTFTHGPLSQTITVAVP